MKKSLLALAITVALSSSVAIAAPLTDLQKGESEVGYVYWKPSITAKDAGYSFDFGNSNANGLYAQTAVTDKVIIGIETMNGSKDATVSGVKAHADTRFTDVTAQYKINNNFRIIAGTRTYDTTVSASSGNIYASASGTETKFVYGFGATASIGEKTSAYAAYSHDDYTNEYQIGVNQDLAKNVTLNLNYRSHDEKSVELKGVGVGISYKF